MDPSAVILARDHDLILHVLDIQCTGAMDGVHVGTQILTDLSPAPTPPRRP